MTYTIVAIRGPDEHDDSLYPRVDDAASGALLDATDRNETYHSAKSMEIYRLDGRKDAILSLEKVRIVVAVTDSRVVLACKKYEKGGGWVGFGVVGLATMAVANTVSHARAAARRKGNCLVGHARYSWIVSVGHASLSRMFSTDELLRIIVQDGLAGGGGNNMAIHLTIDSASSARSIADDIVRRVAAYRLENAPGLNDEKLAKLERLRVSGADGSSSRDSYAMTMLPGGYVVRADTAWYTSPESDTDETPQLEPAEDSQGEDSQGEDRVGDGDGDQTLIEPHPQESLQRPAVPLTTEPVTAPHNEDEEAALSRFCHSCGTGFERGERSCWKCGEARRHKATGALNNVREDAGLDGSHGDSSIEADHAQTGPEGDTRPTVATETRIADMSRNPDLPDIVPAPQTNISPRDRANCPHCDEEIPVSALFCAYCGEAITPVDGEEEVDPDKTVKRSRRHAPDTDSGH